MPSIELPAPAFELKKSVSACPFRPGIHHQRENNPGLQLRNLEAVAECVRYGSKHGQFI
jgi:hypothetical protein